MTFRERNLEPYWAINGTHYEEMDKIRNKHPREGRQPFPFQVYVHRNGHVVTSIRIKFPLVAPSGPRAKYAHIPRFAWIAWRNGKPVKMQTRFMCGGYSWTARGVTEEENQLPVCVKCRLVVTGSESVVACLDRIEKQE